MELFPYPIIRIAGLSIDLIQSNYKEKLELIKIIDAFLEEKNKLESDKSKLIYFLYESINKVRDVSLKKELIKIKRSAIGHRPIKYTSSIDKLPNNNILNYNSNIYQLQKRKENIEQLYNSILLKERLELKDLFQKQELKSGLLLSSHTLLKNLDKYKPDLKDYNKKFYQLECGMFKYATRISTKTSPFSTFTTVGLVKFKTNKKVYNNINGLISGTPKSNVKFNYFLFKQFIICLKVNKQFRKHFLIRLNSSILIKANYCHFLLIKNNIEVFQKLYFNDTLILIYKKLLSKKKYKYYEILNILKSKIKEDEMALENYLLDLIYHGFLEIDIGFPATDNLWEYKLLKFITNKVSPQNTFDKTLVNNIEEVIHLRKSYEDSKSFRERERIIEIIYRLYKEIIVQLTSNSDYLIKKPNDNYFIFYRILANKQHLVEFDFSLIQIENIFYEDVRRDLNVNMSIQEVESAFLKINDLFNYKTSFKNFNSDAIAILNFYKERYKNLSVSLLSLYEEYYKDKKEKELKKNENITDKNPIPQRNNSISQLILRQTQWEEGFRKTKEVEQIKIGKELHFTQSFLSTVNKEISINSKNSNQEDSFSSFAQLYKDNSDENLKVVLGFTLQGHGRLYSRFLNLLPKKVLSEIKKWNEKLKGSNEEFVENVDSSAFNANLHPPIMDYEINIPSGNNLVKVEFQFPVSNLYVKFNPHTEKLELFDKLTQKRLSIFDLGFQDTKTRSNLYQFLELFSKKEDVSNFILQIFNKYFTDVIELDSKIPEKIHFSPRIVFDASIVLQRKRWLVPKSCLPKASGSDLEYFILFNSWRKKICLPDEIFVRIRKNDDDLSKINSRVFSRDNYKPQYIDCNSPISINYFNKLISKTQNNYFILEEMLPNSNQLIMVNGEKTVTEFVVQWNYHARKN